VVHGLEVEYYDKINFVYLDVDDSRTDEFKRLLGYRVQPHIFLLDGQGNIIQQWLGIVPEGEFRSAFDNIS
jgi:thioredoxin-related protein